MSRFQIHVNVGSRGIKRYEFIYNKHGRNYEYSIDGNGDTWIFHHNDVKYLPSHDDRLWPIYLKDNNGIFYPWAETTKGIDSKTLTIPLYFQKKNDRVHIIRVKNATVEEVYSFVPRRPQTITYENEVPSADFLKSVHLTKREILPLRRKYILNVDDSDYYFQDFKHRISEIGYVKLNEDDPVALILSGSYFYPGTEMYPVIIRNRKGQYTQEKFDIHLFDKKGGEWYEKTKDAFFGGLHVPTLLNLFRNDFIFFQVDDNGILQLFHARANEKDNFTFTGRAFDLNFRSPRYIPRI